MAGKLLVSSSSYVSFGTSALLKTPSFSVSAWIWRTANTNTGAVWCNYNYDGFVYKGALLQIQTDGTIYFWVGNGSGFANGHIRQTTTTFGTGAWHHLLACYASLGASRIFIDGVECTYVAAGNAITPSYAAGNPTYCGRLDVGATPYYRSDMYVTDLRYYNTHADLLSAQMLFEERGRSLETGAYLQHTNLVALWHMDEGAPGATATGITDLGANGLAGTPSNVTYIEAPLRLRGKR